MAKNVLVIVESPTKAKTIRKFLPKNFTVEASVGHIRDLPQSASEIPAAYKKEDWAKIGVNVDQNFEPLYVVPKTKSKVIADLKKKLKDSDELYLATDEDREGESIAWHLEEVLKPKIPVKRMVFHEITKSAIEKALTQTREIDDKLVRAQETRRILDRLVGYSLSPLLWKKICFGLSAGRVQSVALRVIVQRERERIQFKKAEYWDLEATFEKNSEKFTATLISHDGKRLATGKDFDEKTGKLSSGKDVLILGSDEAEKLAKDLKSGKFTVQSLEERPLTNRPSPPFITSTLQQEASRKLGLSSRDAMRTAQRLYEEGFITYMRTDSPNLSQEAIKAARREIQSLYGKDYLSDEPRQYTAKTRGAQEAHEAIRPAGSDFVHPKDTGLSGVELALYDLIWKRTIATQMAEAKKLSMTAKIVSGKDIFTATGTRITFPGFLRAYVEGRDDPEAALEDREVVLPALKEGENVALSAMKPLGHETKPPARFTEASLIQTLEKEGIGRPSTYASIIGTIVERGYVRKAATALVPTFTGFAVTQLLEKNFANLVDLGFTSEMESSLDDIAEGKIAWLPYLQKFFLGKTGLREQIKSQEKKIDPDESRAVDLPHIKGVEVRIGRFGPYIVKAGSKTSDEVHASIPENIPPADLTAADVAELLEISERGPQSLGKDPVSGLDIFCLTGRYGPYVQLGPTPEDKEAPKPRRSSLLKGMEPKTITVEEALKLLSLPRELGVHPVSGKPILTNQGRFGPYVVHEKDYRSLKKTDDLFTVDLKRALELLSEEKKGRGGASMVKDLGPHPKDKKPVGIYDGKYGMYVKHDKTNATLPKDTNPANVTMEEAVALLTARQAVSKTKIVRGGRRKSK